MKFNNKKDSKSVGFIKNKNEVNNYGQQQSKSDDLLQFLHKKNLFKHQTKKCDKEINAKNVLKSFGVSLASLFKINVRNCVCIRMITA